MFLLKPHSYCAIATTAWSLCYCCCCSIVIVLLLVAHVGNLSSAYSVIQLYYCYYCYYVHNKDAPVVTSEAIDETLNEGDTTFFTCQATGTPNPNISWYFNGAPVETTRVNKYMISEMSFNPTTKNSTLKITNVELFDTGTYSCDAVNILGSQINSRVLTVKGTEV